MSYTPSGATLKLIAIEQLPKEEFFRLKGGKQVYIYYGYCRQTKKYYGQAFDDINKFTYKKKGTIVEWDFEF